MARPLINQIFDSLKPPIQNKTAADDGKALVFDQLTNTFEFQALPSAVSETGNFNVAYAYNADGKVQTETYTGDISKTTTYTYYDSSSEFNGKVKTETVVQNGKTIAKTYSYETGTGRIVGVAVTTT
jgi:YD repeat-containing protein